jgi:hypothetical protein
MTFRSPIDAVSGTRPRNDTGTCASPALPMALQRVGTRRFRAFLALGAEVRFWDPRHVRPPAVADSRLSLAPVAVVLAIALAQVIARAKQQRQGPHARYDS